MIDIGKENSTAYGAKQSFPQMILENLKTVGVQQAHKEDRIAFTALTPWPGELVCAEGRYPEGKAEKRAAIFIGPEFGTVQRADLVAGAREGQLRRDSELIDSFLQLGLLGATHIYHLRSWRWRTIWQAKQITRTMLSGDRAQEGIDVPAFPASQEVNERELG